MILFLSMMMAAKWVVVRRSLVLIGDVLLSKISSVSVLPFWVVLEAGLSWPDPVWVYSWR